MLEFHNAKERDIDDWTKLFEDTDSRFKIQGVKKPLNSRLSIIEVIWMGHDIENLGVHSR